ncbi:hypothetical protein [Massilia sp. TWR1-2-2]|uniref:hypothetical protein n=1 Tax=Massilia sp. TWR1-2-2 TaxID=2804584 RepID=UPI003CF15DC9
MSTVNLTYTVVTDPDSFVGFKYYVKAGDMFDADDFAASYKLNRAELDADDLRATQDAAATLAAGEWLAVSHSIAA